MSRPKQVRIAARRVILHYTDLMPDVSEADGTYLSGPGVIAVSNTLGFDQERETALHEALHGVIDVTGLRGKDKAKEERLVATLSPALFALIRDNPKFIAYLQETS